MKPSKLCFIMTASLLAACAQQSHRTTDLSQLTTPQERSKQAETTASQLTSWTLTGAMAAKSERKSWSANIHWSQQGANAYQIRLLGPLGSGSLLVEQHHGRITLIDGAKSVSSNNASTLLKEQTGIGLPVHHLYYWVRGLPAPVTIQAEQHDEKGHLIGLKQAGFSIHYANYRLINGMALPSKIQLYGNGITMKMAIKHWAAS